MLPPSLQVRRRHLAVLRDVRQIHDGRLADPLRYRHLGDVLRAGQKMERGIHVREGMAVNRQHCCIEQVAPRMGRPQLRGNLPAKMRLDRERQIHDAHWIHS